jgi:hypothetical protein
VISQSHASPVPKSSYTTASSFPTSRHKAPSKSSTSESASPSSIRTFAALWDPETGLLAFTRGKLAKFVPSAWPSPSSYGPSPSVEHHSYGYVNNIRRGFYLRVLPEPHSVAPSSAVGGHPHEPHFSCFDPLNEELHFEPHLRPPDAVPIDDDYVMEGFDFGHPDDPHLVCVLSTYLLFHRLEELL